MTDLNPIPEYVDLEKWREQNYEWKGEFKLTDFPRLAELVNPDAERDEDNIISKNPSLEFSIKYKSGVTWFAFTVGTCLELNCQRCLEPMSFSFGDNSLLALLDDESQESIIDEDYDWLIIDEVAVRVGSELRLPIASTIEDELLLQIPNSFKHDIGDDACVPVDIIDEDDIEIQENPFAALTELQKFKSND